MTVALNRPFAADLQQTGVTGWSCGPTIVKMIGTDDKPISLPPYSGPPPPPQMHHRIPPEAAHGLPNAPGVYHQPWRPYPPSFEHHHAEQQRASNPPQPSLPPHGYPVIPNRELPQLPPEGPYGRPNNLPAPRLIPTESHPPTFRPMNGASHDSMPHSTPPHPAPPHSAPPEFHPRMTYHPQEQSSNGDRPPQPPPYSHTMPPAPYEPNPYQNQAVGMRQRKPARAQQACDQCRTRKAKCDEGRPACSHCKENNLICVYKEVPPHKQEKATQVILDMLQYVEDKLDERVTSCQAVQIQHGVTIAKISHMVGVKESNILAVKDTARSMQPKQTDRLLKPSAADPLLELESNNGEGMQQLDPNEPAGQSYMEREDSELSMPVEHTTAAHKLLSWPSIKNLLYPREYDEDYVMRKEEIRGLIRIYGRGEGDDTSEDRMSPTPLPSSNSSSGWDDTHQASPSSSWSQSAHPSGFPQKLKDRGVDEFGTLWADPDTIHRYHHSYLKHMHKLHPFLDQSDLEKKIEIFIKFYCLSKTPGGSTPTGTGEMPRGAKRKRSCETLQGAACDFQTSAMNHRIEKSIDNAVLLLVLALGSICEQGPPVPGPVTDTPPDFRKEWIPGPPTRSILSPAGSDMILPAQGSFYTSNPHAIPSPSPVDGRRSVGGQSASSGPSPANCHLRNIDVIPGLSYYAYATQILGPLQGANSLLHVQACLLAGLYAGQLAHPVQSHAYIFQAGRACQTLIRSKRYDQMQDGPLKDLYDFAYWTCLQLESDILAELDLPASGISRAESRISLPKGRFTLALPNEIGAPSTMMMFFYSSQIHLRKVLNRVHTDLYKVERQPNSNAVNPGIATNAASSASAVNAAIAAITANPSSSTTTQSSSSNNRWTSNVHEILSMNLEMWRNSLPEIMKWKDTDPPSKDINVARMRAKYYGARYIIHRPLLYHALHYAGLPPNTTSASVESPAGSILSGSKSQQVSPSINMARLSSDMGTAVHSCPPSFQGGPGSMSAIAYRDLPPKLRRACKVCIDSAILSTEAFDGIDGRPIVTNIFGTAHAQFGNMLVLSATYMSCLSELVDRNVLEKLLKRTIKFLLQSRYISPTLRADARILTEIYEKIFGWPATSFSSAYS